MEDDRKTEAHYKRPHDSQWVDRNDVRAAKGGCRHRALQWSITETGPPEGQENHPEKTQAHRDKSTSDRYGRKTTLEEQEALEAQMVQKGHDRYEARQAKLKGSSQEAAHVIIADALPKVAEVITQYIANDETRFKSGQGKKSFWYDELKDQDPLTMAYLGLNCCYDAVINASTYGATLVAIGARVENESWAKELKLYDKDLYKRLVKQVTKDHSSERYRFKAARHIAKSAGFSRDKWSAKSKVSLGSPILNAILEACDIFLVTTENTVEMAGRGVKHNTNRHISLTPTAEIAVRDKAFSDSWASPMFMPLVVPPKPWTAFDTGVYQDEILGALTPMVRKSTAEQRRAVKHDFIKGIPDYVKAINALQATPLKINKKVVEVIKWIRDEGKRFEGFPDLDPPEQTPYPENPDEHSEEYISQVRKDRKKWHAKKREAVTNVCVLQEDLKTMDYLAGFDQFYLGWSFDFRGRMYPVSHYNYHRDDHIKATFMFARGKKLDETAQGWLMIQLANVGDFDKVSKQSLENRIQWVMDNEEMILACANDYVSTYDTWTKADKPMQFLAACWEYQKMLTDGLEYVCHLPISLDGTNSGTQHYSLALRNHHDAAMVNLVPSDECQDVYQIVADAVTERLKAEDTPEAKAWLDWGISRKTVKRNTMTFGYNSVQRGMGDQIIEDLMHPLQKQVNYNEISNHPFGDEKSQTQHARYLAAINYDVISNTLESVSDGMVFLQSYADALAREQKSVRWRSPSGFPCVARYTKDKAERARIFLYDRQAKILKETRVNVQQDTNVFDTRKSRSSIAANWVHSLDSGHMCQAILTGLEAGIDDFFMIHDSFGTQGADTWAFYHCIRASLVDIYEGTCVLSDFERECRSRLANPDQDLAKVPTKGSLDVSSVLNSEYCFS